MRKGYTVAYKRKRKNKTDYYKRLKLLASKTTRIAIRKSLHSITVQFIHSDINGDKTMASVSSFNLKKYGWKGSTANIPSAYLTGLLAGLIGKKKGVKKAILDLGLQRSTKGSKIYAALKGAIDAGIEIPHSNEILPPEERISGKHIADYAKTGKVDFSLYAKKGMDPKDLQKHFEEVKSKILKEK